MTKTVGMVLVATLLLFGAGCSCDSPSEKEEDRTPPTKTPTLPDVPKKVTAVKKSKKVAPESGDTKDATPRKNSEDSARVRWDQAKRDVNTSPFELSIASAYLEGECARGPIPEKRENTDGIRARLRGSLTYRGKDLLMEAAIEGALVLDVNGTNLVEIPFRFEGGRKPSTAIPRMVRGADPWVAGQTREFYLETMPMSEAFCEFVPQAATIHVGLNTFGALGGKKVMQVAAVPIHFDEVVGMAVDTQVQLVEDSGFVPAAAHVARLDQMMITTLDGTTKWISRQKVAYLDGIKRAKGATFPKVLMAGAWKLSINGIASEKQFDDVAPKGEDAFLALIDVTITNQGEEPLTVDDIDMRLEAEPDEWRKLLDAGLGDISDTRIEPGKSAETTAVFLRYRFERPTRLKIDVDGSGTVYVNVFDYSIGPERSPLAN